MTSPARVLARARLVGSRSEHFAGYRPGRLQEQTNQDWMSFVFRGKIDMQDYVCRIAQIRTTASERYRHDRCASCRLGQSGLATSFAGTSSSLVARPTRNGNRNVSPETSLREELSDEKLGQVKLSEINSASVCSELASYPASSLPG